MIQTKQIPPLTTAELVQLRKLQHLKGNSDDTIDVIHSEPLKAGDRFTMLFGKSDPVSRPIEIESVNETRPSVGGSKAYPVWSNVSILFLPK